MPRWKTLPALALSGAVLLGACQNPDGSTDWGSTLLLGAGVGAAAALIAGAASDDGRPSKRYHGYSRRYGHSPRYAYGGPPHAAPWGGGYRTW
jgi:drug/metabolite transporter (DMT)-like permease